MKEYTILAFGSAAVAVLFDYFLRTSIIFFAQNFWLTKNSGYSGR